MCRIGLYPWGGETGPSPGAGTFMYLDTSILASMLIVSASRVRRSLSSAALST